MNTQHVLITGAGQRLGLHCAQTLLEKGHQVTITYRTEKVGVDRLRDMGARCIQADFASDDGISRCIDEIKAKANGITAIVHNASTWSSDTPEQRGSIFDNMMQVHAKAPYLINYALEEAFRDSLKSITHISDFVSQVGSTKHTAYAASKAALDNLTLSFARKWAPAIRVNSISPSMIIFNEHDDAAYRQKALAKSLVGIEPGESVVTNTLLYLLENAYVTGQIISLNGGRNLNLP
ncbi:dihydromonapterin reductase [Alteromonas sp. a30]|uniref:dihydromonapterin reductase n=1 Tax=Alteromonas sp. a30 TaxID=2730917 RepID=UPI00227EB28C|nr:dihydromonapterin reductase [Alteromonas sp. a30]MCY7294301.1 dihydromonapterin reductase [Alteromonas sp. a30]